MACDVDALLLDGACYTCLTPRQRALVKISLLCSISAAISGGGGGGGGGGVQFAQRGSGSPEGVVTGGTIVLYYDITGNTFWAFRGTSGLNTGWEELIA